jgi:hypothetical protein
MSSNDEPYARSLPPGHRCRVDDLAYDSVSDWYRDHIGHVPVQAAAALGRLTHGDGTSFPDAYRLLLKRGAIILSDPAADGEPD